MSKDERYIPFEHHYRPKYGFELLKGTHLLGKHIVLGEKVSITDPCYDPATWCQASVDNMKPGKYEPGVKVVDEDQWGTRIAESFIIHEDVNLWAGGIAMSDWQLVKGAHVGVDSGQAGFFDYLKWLEIFEGHDDKDKNPKFETFYDEIGGLTLGRFEGLEGYKQLGIYKDWGFVSSTGYGDGGYSLYKVERDGQVVALRIVFIEEEEEADDE